MTPIHPSALAVDPSALGDLRARAAKDPAGTLKEAAQQFEALLLDQVMKSMRKAAAPGRTLFDNEGTRMFTELLDHEFAEKLAAQGGLGLADMLVRQLSPRLAAGQEKPVSADNVPNGTRARR